MHASSSGRASTAALMPIGQEWLRNGRNRSRVIAHAHAWRVGGLASIVEARMRRAHTPPQHSAFAIDLRARGHRSIVPVGTCSTGFVKRRLFETQSQLRTDMSIAVNPHHIILAKLAPLRVYASDLYRPDADVAAMASVGFWSWRVWFRQSANVASDLLIRPAGPAVGRNLESLRDRSPVHSALGI